MTFLHLSADKQQKEVWSSRLQKWLHERFGVYIEDFRFQPEESTVEAEEPLSAKRWVRVGLEKQHECAQLQSHQRKTEALFSSPKCPFFPPVCKEK